MASTKSVPYHRIRFTNPITNKNQVLKIKEEIILNASKYPIPISTLCQDKILTLYIDSNFVVRATEKTAYFPDLLPVSTIASEAEVKVEEMDTHEKTCEEQFHIIKNQIIDSSVKKNHRYSE